MIVTFGTILLGIVACSLFVIGTGAVNISMSDHSYSSEVSFVICKDSSLSDNVSILLVLLS